MPGASVTSGMFAASVSMTTVLTFSAMRGAMALISAAKLLSTNSTLSCGVIDDVGDVVGVQAGIDGVADRLHARRGVIHLQMPVAVPGQRADAVLGADPSFCSTRTSRRDRASTSRQV